MSSNLVQSYVRVLKKLLGEIPECFTTRLPMKAKCLANGVVRSLKVKIED